MYLGVHPNPKPTANAQLRQRFGSIARCFPNGIILLEEQAKILHTRPIEERITEEGKSVKVAFDPQNRAHQEIQTIMKNPSAWLDVEKYLDVRIGLNGQITVATCCTSAECQKTECLCRR